MTTEYHYGDKNEDSAQDALENAIENQICSSCSLDHDCSSCAFNNVTI